jgi:DNA-binding NarL/FixJ family response regulator
MNEIIRVLIADDHGVVREGLRTLLERSGLQVVGEATTGRQAVELTLALQPQVVLLDIRMPDGDGLQALAAIKKACPQVIVLMLTTYTNPGYLARAIAAGAAGYLSKETDPTRIPKAIHAAAQGDELIDRSLLNSALGLILRQPPPEQFPMEELSEPLTQREEEVLVCLASGLDNNAICEQLVISANTLKTHIRHIFAKLGVSDRTQAALWALEHGLVKPPG